MNSRQRIESAFNHIEPDRTPIFEYVLLPARAEDFLQRQFPDYIDNRVAWLSLCDEIGLEEALEISDSLDPVVRVQERNLRAKETALAGSSDAAYLVYDGLIAEMRKKDVDLPILAPAYVHGIWTDIDLMQTMVLDPDTAHRHFELATARAIEIVGHYLSLGIKIIGIGGDFSGNAPLISPQFYSEFIVPEIRKLASFIADGGGHIFTASNAITGSIPMENYLAMVNAYREYFSLPLLKL